MSDSYLCHFVTPSKVHSCYNKSILKKKKKSQSFENERDFRQSLCYTLHLDWDIVSGAWRPHARKTREAVEREWKNDKVWKTEDMGME